MEIVAFLGTSSCSSSSGTDSGVMLRLVFASLGLVLSIILGGYLVFYAKDKGKRATTYLTVPIAIGLLSLFVLVPMLLVSGIQSSCI